MFLPSESAVLSRLVHLRDFISHPNSCEAQSSTSLVACPFSLFRPSLFQPSHFIQPHLISLPTRLLAVCHFPRHEGSTHEEKR